MRSTRVLLGCAIAVAIAVSGSAESLRLVADAGLRAAGYRVTGPALASVGLYFEGAGVLRIMRNVEATRIHVSYDDARWDVDAHAYLVERGDAAALDAAPQSPPFWIGAELAGSPSRVERLGALYRALDAIDRLHPPGVRRARHVPRPLPHTALTTGVHDGDGVLVVLVRGRERPNREPVSRFFVDAFVNARYEVSGTLVSVFLIDTRRSTIVGWNSRIEGRTTAEAIRRTAGDLVTQVAEDSRGR